MSKERVTNTTYKYLKLSIEHVFRANFNDSYYLDTPYFELSEFNKDELVWFDPYCGRSKINDTLVAFKSITDKEYVILEKRNGEIKESRNSIDFLYICCEDYDKSLLLASHFYFCKEKSKY